jgi:hypothetical protein
MRGNQCQDLFFSDRVSPCSPSWPHICDPSTSPCLALELLAQGSSYTSFLWSQASDFNFYLLSQWFSQILKSSEHQKIHHMEKNESMKAALKYSQKQGMRMCTGYWQNVYSLDYGNIHMAVLIMAEILCQLLYSYSMNTKQ